MVRVITIVSITQYLSQLNVETILSARYEKISGAKESTICQNTRSKFLRGVYNTERQSEQSGNLNRLGVHLGNDRHRAANRAGGGVREGEKGDRLFSRRMGSLVIKLDTQCTGGRMCSLAERTERRRGTRKF